MNDDEIESTVKDLQLRGLENTKEFIAQCLDWKMNIGKFYASKLPIYSALKLLRTYSDPDASNTWLRQKKILYQDVRITKFEIFFDFFEGEEWIINSTMTFNFINDHRPMGCLCWRNWFSCFQHRVPYVSRRVV